MRAVFAFRILDNLILLCLAYKLPDRRKIKKANGLVGSITRPMCGGDPQNCRIK